jgi:hypothetical protein
VPDDRVPLDQLVATPNDVARSELLDLYKLALDEYRFEVTLNWQRTQYYFTVNTAVIAAASILKVNGLDGWLPPLIVGTLFVVGYVTARLARRMIDKGHTYYRRAVYKKTLIEHLLGRFHSIGSDPSANLAIATTEGMLEARAILSDPKGYSERGPSKGSITHMLFGMMSMFMVGNALLALLCFALAASRGASEVQRYIAKGKRSTLAPITRSVLPQKGAKTLQPRTTTQP